MGGATLECISAESTKKKTFFVPGVSMDSSLGFKVISRSKADANMDDDELSDGASTGFEVQGPSELFCHDILKFIYYTFAERAIQRYYKTFVVP